MSNYQERQRSRVLKQLAEHSALFEGAAGGGVFIGLRRPFVLDQAEKNLFGAVRSQVQAYFEKNRISWWGGKRVTGHTLSSQVACVNHLFAWRENFVAALAVLRGVSPDFVRPLRIETDVFQPGYVQFEAVSQHQYLNEDGLTRGTQCTSIDALMYAEHRDGSRWLVPIEWKYTEHYGNDNKAEEGVATDPVNGKGAVRQRRYTDLIKGSSQLVATDMSVYYFEPFYQLMRQTLLAEQMVRHRQEEGLQADSFLHVHVIPAGNSDLLNKRYSCSGLEMERTWRKQLRDETKYRIVDPQQLLAPLDAMGDYSRLRAYLQERYWGNP
jgi:hypothetical protein